MFFKNLKVFRLGALSHTADELNTLLNKFLYQEGGATDAVSQGWVPPCPHASNGVVHAVDGQYLLTLRMDKKLLPAAVVNKHTKARVAEIEKRQGYKPGRKQTKEIKEQVTDELLPKAFTVPSDTTIWIDTRNKWFVIDTGSSTKADEALGMLAKAIDPFPVVPLYVEQSPAGCMTEWLAQDEAPAGFSIDQDTELRSSNESGATVKYVRQSVEQTDVHKHIKEGKQVTRLALTWQDRISFVITDNFDIKRVSPLDVLKENTDSNDAAEKFDSEFALMAGELAKLLSEMVEAFGGEKEIE